MTNYEVLKKLIGPISPVGDASQDPVRLENLKAMIQLAYSATEDIWEIVQFNSGAHEDSIKKAVAKAKWGLKELQNLTTEHGG